MVKYKDMDGVKITSWKDGELWKQYTGKDRKLMKTYGITEKYYDILLEKQKYKCAICKIYRHITDGKKLAIDHCHDTGVVRGLLCHMCNNALGLLRDDTEIINNAIKYLDESRKASELR
jgi:hypothetical protein